MKPGAGSAPGAAFAPFVPRWVRERIASGRPLGDDVELSVSRACLLLADLSGFTSFTAEACARKDRGAEQVQEVLNSCFGRLADHVQAFGGEVLAFPGDAALGFWPLAEAAAPADAVSAAAACAREILSDVDGSVAPGGFTLRLRVAVSAGPVWQALVGGEDGRWESLVGGAAVEQLAATLARTRPGDGVLSPGAARALGLAAWASVPLPARERPAPGAAPVALGAELEPALRRFIPHTVQERIDARQTDWLAEFRRVNVMFVRITGLPDPTSDPAALQAITRAVQSAVFGFGGSITQFVVDEKGPTLLAGWGIAHHAHEDNAVRAVFAGLAVERALRDLGAAGAIGIATGRVWTGRRGNSSRSEFAMIGDTVNLAARLMQASENTTLCDEATMREAERSRAFEPMGTIPLKGRASAPVFRPLEGRVVREASRRAASELFGRVEEQRRISDAIETLARQGRGGIVVVSGDAGVGKSHLVAKSLERADAFGLATDVFEGTAVGHSSPYAEAREPIRRRVGLDACVDDAARVAKLRDLLPEAEALLPLLADALGIACDTHALSESMPPQLRAEATRDLLVRLYEKVTGGGPTLLVLEDAHWMNSSIWALAAALRERVPSLLLLVATRPVAEVPSALAAALVEAPGAIRLELDALGPEEIASLVCQRLGVDSVPELVGRLVHEKSEGHPFFAEELAYALRDRGLVQLRRRECVLTGDGLEALELPDTVEDVVTSRIDLLGAAEQLTLKVAAVLGRQFDLATLEPLHPIGASTEELREQLDAMARLHLVVSAPGEARFEFKHAITQQVAYGLLAFAQRKRLHRAAAERLEAGLADAVRPPYGLLAHHWRHAEDGERTLLYLERAGNQASEDYANTEAVGFYRDVIAYEAEHRESRDDVDASTRRASWHRRLGEAQSNLGNLRESMPALRAALRELGRKPPSSDLGWGLRIAGELARQLGRRVVPAALRRERREARLLEAVRAHSLLGANYYVLDQPLGFVGALFSAAGVSDAIGPTRERALAYADMGNVAGIIPLHGLARRYGAVALETAARLAEPRTKARIATRTAIYLGAAGTWRVDELGQALEIAERLGDWHLWEETAAVLSVHHYFRGELALCFELGQRVTASAVRTRSLLHRLWGLATQAVGQLHRANYAAAAETSREALGLLDDDGRPDRDAAIQAHAILGAALYRQGHIGPALASAERSSELIRRFGRTGYQLFPGASAVADLYLRAWEEGRSAPGTRGPEERLPALLGHLTVFSKRFLAAEPRTRVLRARAHALAGHPSRAVAELAKAVEAGERLGTRLDLALARLEWARSDAGSAEERAASFAAARAAFEHVGAKDELERALRIGAELAISAEQ